MAKKYDFQKEMMVQMPSSNKIYDKQNQDWQKASPKVPPMPRTTKKGK